MKLVMLDWVIVAVFLVAITLVGIIASKKAKSNKEELLVAGRNMGLYVMMASLIAGEWCASTMVYQAEAGYLNGLSALTLGLVCTIGAIVIAMGGWFSVWMRRLRIMTVPELMELRYGKVARAITGIAMVSSFLIILGTLMQGVGHMFGVFLGADPKVLMIIMLLIALVYTFTGGMWSVMLTDLLQFLILGAVIPLTAFLAIRRVGGWDALATGVEGALGEQGVNPLVMYGVPTLVYQLIYTAFANAIYPTQLTRVCACRSVRDGYKGTLLGYAAFLSRSVFPVTIGAAALIIVPNLNHGVAAYAEVMTHLLPAGMIGLVFAGLLAAFMSTADTYYLTCASMIPQDVIGPLLGKKKLSDKQTVILLRLGILLGALVGLYVGYYYEGGMLYWVINLAELMFVSGGVTAFFFGMYWKKANQVGACCALGAGLISTTITNYALGMDPHIVFWISMSCTIVAMVVGSLATQKICPPKQITGVTSERRALANGMD